MTIETFQTRMRRTGQRHDRCIICGRRNRRGLGLRFKACRDGSVEASFACPESYEGYSGVLHGGVVSALLDSAMTNCLFAQGLEAFTAELNVRFLKPVRTLHPALVRACLTRSCPPLFRLEATLHQTGSLMARATASFIRRTGSETTSFQRKEIDTDPRY